MKTLSASSFCQPNENTRNFSTAYLTIFTCEYSDNTLHITNNFANMVKDAIWKTVVVGYGLRASQTA